MKRLGAATVVGLFLSGSVGAEGRLDPRDPPHVFPVQVVNDPSQPVPVQCQGTTQVSGAVTVTNTPSVTVSNTPSVQLSPGGTVGIDPNANTVKVAPTAVTPFSLHLDITSTTPGQFTQGQAGGSIPAGQVFVIDFVYAQSVAASSDDVLISVSLTMGSVFHIMDFPGVHAAGVALVDAPVKLYADPGSSVTVGALHSQLANAFTGITLVGHLVPSN